MTLGHKFDDAVIIVDPYSSGMYLAELFVQAGVSLIAVFSDATPPETVSSTYRPELFSLEMRVEGDRSTLVRLIRETGIKIARVLPGFESGVDLAEDLACELAPAFANVPELKTARCNKGAMGQALRQSGVAAIPQICTDDAEAVAAWIEGENLRDRDLVVKPAASAGTDSVIRIPAGQDWRPVFASMIGRKNMLGKVENQAIVQQYVTGTEYVVDTFSADGIHKIMGVCRYEKVESSGQIAVYASLTWIAESEIGDTGLLAYASEVLSAVGMLNGPAHLEIIVTEEGPRLIEVNARSHGAGGPRLCLLATGDSQVHQTVSHTLGKSIDQKNFDLKKTVQLVFIVPLKSGRLKNANVFDQVKFLDSYHYSHINLSNGQEIALCRTLFDSLRYGCITLAHWDKAQVAQDYDAVRCIERSMEVAQ